MAEHEDGTEVHLAVALRTVAERIEALPYTVDAYVAFRWLADELDPPPLSGSSKADL